MGTYRKAMLRIVGIAVSLLLAIVFFATHSPFLAARTVVHELSLSYSDVEIALGHSEMQAYEIYEFWEPATLTVVQSGDMVLSESEENQPVSHTYEMQREIGEIMERLDIPIGSATMTLQALEALERKALIRFFGSGSSGTGCDSCQVIVAADPESGELSVVAVNGEEHRHAIHLSIDGSSAIEQPHTQQFSARLEEALSDEELVVLRRQSGTYVELLSTHRVYHGDDWREEPESEELWEPESHDGPKLPAPAEQVPEEEHDTEEPDTDDESSDNGQQDFGYTEEASDVEPVEPQTELPSPAEQAPEEDRDAGEELDTDDESSDNGQQDFDYTEEATDVEPVEPQTELPSPPEHAEEDRDAGEELDTGGEASDNEQEASAQESDFMPTLEPMALPHTGPMQITFLNRNVPQDGMLRANPTVTPSLGWSGESGSGGRETETRHRAIVVEADYDNIESTEQQGILKLVVPGSGIAICRGLIVPASSEVAYVYNQNDLANALSSATVTDIILGDHIEITSMLNANTSKPYLVIDGQNKGFILSNTAAGYIHMPNTTGSLKEITFQNLKMQGDRGSAAAQDGSVQVTGIGGTIAFLNVDYVGRGLCSNIGGAVIFDDCDIELCYQKSTVDLGEAAIAVDVILRNKVTIKKWTAQPTLYDHDEIFWILTNGSLVIEEGADVAIDNQCQGTINASPTSLAYFTGTNTMTVQRGATLRYTGYTQVFESLGLNSLEIEDEAEIYLDIKANRSTYYHNYSLLNPSNRITVGENAVFEFTVNRTIPNTNRALTTNQILLGEGSRFHIVSKDGMAGTSPLVHITAGGKLQVTNPESFLLYNGASTQSVLNFASGSMEVDATHIITWENTGIPFPPNTATSTRIFSNNNNNQNRPFSLRGTSMNTLSPNYTTTFYTGDTPFNSTTFLLRDIKVLQIMGNALPIDYYLIDEAGAERFYESDVVTGNLGDSVGVTPDPDRYVGDSTLGQNYILVVERSNEANSHLSPNPTNGSVTVSIGKRQKISFYYALDANDNQIPDYLEKNATVTDWLVRPHGAEMMVIGSEEELAGLENEIKEVLLDQSRRDRYRNSDPALDYIFDEERTKHYAEQKGYTYDAVQSKLLVTLGNEPWNVRVYYSLDAEDTVTITKAMGGNEPFLENEDFTVTLTPVDAPDDSASPLGTPNQLSVVLSHNNKSAEVPAHASDPGKLVYGVWYRVEEPGLDSKYDVPVISIEGTETSGAGYFRLESPGPQWDDDRNKSILVTNSLMGFDSDLLTVDKELVEENGSPLDGNRLPDPIHNETFTIRLTAPNGQIYSGTVVKEGPVTWNPPLPSYIPYGDYTIFEDTPSSYYTYGVTLIVGEVRQSLTEGNDGYRFTLDADDFENGAVAIIVHNTPIGFRTDKQLEIVKTIDGQAWDGIDPPEAQPFSITLTGTDGSLTGKTNAATGRFEFTEAPLPPYILPSGNYTLAEDAKEGYVLGGMWLTVTKNGIVSEPEEITENGAFAIDGDTEHIRIVVDNIRLHPLILRKVAAGAQGENYTGLPDSMFDLYTCTEKTHLNSGDHGRLDGLLSSGCWEKVREDIPSTASGLLDFGRLRPGHYALVETQAPDDYALPRGYWVFVLTNTGELEQITGVGQPPAFVALEKPDTDQVTYLITNYDRNSLPLSGAGGYGLFAGSVICILTGFILVCFRRRGER